MAKRRESAAAMVKRLKREVPGLVRDFTAHMRRGDCRGASDVLGRLAMMDSFPGRHVAYSGRAPHIHHAKLDAAAEQRVQSEVRDPVITERVRYRKSKNAPGSTARMFHKYVQSRCR